MGETGVLELAGTIFEEANRGKNLRAKLEMGPIGAIPMKE